MNWIRFAALLALLPAIVGCGQIQDAPPVVAEHSYPEPINEAFTQEELGAPVDWAALSETDKSFLSALEDRDAASAKSALAAGANADLNCGHGCNALMLAAATGDADLVAAIRQAGGTETPAAAPYLEILNFPKNAEQPDFQAALQEIARLTGETPAPSERPSVLTIQMESEAARKFLKEHHRPLVQKGCHVFLYEQRFGLDGQTDTLMILPTSDKFAVMAFTGVDGINYEIENHLVIRWLQKLDKEQPFVLTGCGFDFLSGEFENKLTDADVMAQRMYAFCPDIVDQGAGSVEKLAEELRKSNELYFWWD